MVRSGMKNLRYIKIAESIPKKPENKWSESGVDLTKTIMIPNILWIKKFVKQDKLIQNILYSVNPMEGIFARNRQSLA